ncbi:hypothetical protein BHM03_00028767 [Ensete ventricosum]|nr:hypothetical protein BHM03_00028767 [Ensete ventricosum]
MKSDDGTGSGSAIPSTNSASTTIGVVGFMAEKNPNIGEESSLRKCSKRVTPEQPADASRSTSRVPAEKGKETVEIKEAPEREYTIRELCEVEDRAGANKYFASLMTGLKTVEGEDPLISRWSAISELSQVWTEGPLFGEYLRGALHPALAKQVYECSSEELMNRARKSTGFHFVSALIDRVHDAGWLVRTQHERILVLRTANKELKLGANQELVAVTKFHVKGLEEDVKKLRAELESLKN